MNLIAVGLFAFYIANSVATKSSSRSLPNSHRQRKDLNEWHASSSCQQHLRRRGFSSSLFSCFCRSKTIEIQSPQETSESIESTLPIQSGFYTCLEIEFVFLSRILADGFGDAVGLARTIKLFLDIYPTVHIKVIISDMYQDYFQKPLGFFKFQELAANMGISNQIRAELVNNEICEGLSHITRNPDSIIFAGPTGISTAVCTLSNTENMILIGELNYNAYCFGVHPDGWGMPLPDKNDYLKLLFSDFDSEVLRKLFSKNNRPIFIYMKSLKRIVSLIDEIDAMNGRGVNLNVIVLGYEYSDLRHHLCNILKDINYMGKVACRTKIGGQRQIIIHHFKDQPIGHEDFIRALQRSFDIVGVTGDQSYLEALSMGKIPVRDDLKHKKSFDKSIKQFIKGNFDDKPNTPLLKLFYNIESGGLDRKHLVIEELPRIKQEMKLVEDKLRTEFDPKQRVKRAVSKVLEKILGEFYSKSRQ